MASALRQYRAEIQAHLSATGLDRSLQWRHLGLVLVGLSSCLAVLAANLTLPPRDLEPWRHWLGLGLGLTYLCVCLLISLGEQLTAYRRLRVVTDGLGQRVALLSRHLLRRDIFLLVLALGGHAVAWVQSALGLRFWSADVVIVILPLVPTMQLVWIGLDEVPTRGRLVFLYKLVALYSERAR